MYSFLIKFYVKKRYGYDSSTYSDKPTAALDAFLSEILPSLPVDLMPGESDPVGPTMPQQPLHPALLEGALGFERYSPRTNPFWCDIGGARCVYSLYYSTTSSNLLI